MVSIALTIFFVPCQSVHVFNIAIAILDFSLLLLIRIMLTIFVKCQFVHFSILRYQNQTFLYCSQQSYVYTPITFAIAKVIALYLLAFFFTSLWLLFYIAPSSVIALSCTLKVKNKSDNYQYCDRALEKRPKLLGAVSASILKMLMLN